MKATELMIGDWVLFSDEPKRVRSIVVSDDNRVERIYVFDKSCQVSTIEAYIQPIPLTPEILEKNGFVKELDSDGIHYRFTLIQGYSRFSLLYARSVFQWLYPIDFKYVHELQHALKLCRIEKTIEL